MSIQNSLTKGSIISILKNLQYPHDNVTIFRKNARKFPGRSTGGGGEICLLIPVENHEILIERNLKTFQKARKGRK